MSKDITAWSVDEEGFVLSQFDDGGVSSGIHNVLQRVLCVLLTETGSQRYTFGREVPRACPFMTLWQQGHMFTESDVAAHFQSAARHIAAAMQEEETEDDPPEQRFKRLQLNNIIVQPGVMQLVITLTTEAESMQFILPLPT